MQAGWIKIDKEAAAGPLVRRTKDDVADLVQEALQKIASMKIEDVDEKLKGDLKKRKLVVEVETKFYELTKGPSFNTGNEFPHYTLFVRDYIYCHGLFLSVFT